MRRPGAKAGWNSIPKEIVSASSGSELRVAPDEAVVLRGRVGLDRSVLRGRHARVAHSAAVRIGVAPVHGSTVPFRPTCWVPNSS